MLSWTRSFSWASGLDRSLNGKQRQFSDEETAAAAGGGAAPSAADASAADLDHV